MTLPEMTWSAAGNAVMLGVIQLVLVVVGAPLLVGVMRQVRARAEGRVGAGVLQPWRTLRKLWGKEPIRPHGSSWVFTGAPSVVLASTLLIAVIAPFVSTASPTGAVGDLFTVVALLLVATVALALAGLDTGTAFGGMGASRALTVSALAEPTILVAGFALSVRVGSSNLPAIVEAAIHAPALVFSPTSVLAAVALGVVIVAETGRLPVDNPTTHLELTMIHESMALEYSGRDLAMVQVASAARLTVLLGLWANFFLPWGTAVGSAPVDLLLAVAVFVLKVGLLGALLAAAELFMAKLRLFRVPELLAGSFMFGVLAVASSFFLA